MEVVRKSREPVQWPPAHSQAPFPGMEWAVASGYWNGGLSLFLMKEQPQGSSSPLRTGHLHVAFGKCSHQCLAAASRWTASLGTSAIVWHWDLSEGTEDADIRTTAYPVAITGNTEIPNRSWDLSEPHILTLKWRNRIEGSDTRIWFWQCLQIFIS